MEAYLLPVAGIAFGIVGIFIARHKVAKLEAAARQDDESARAFRQRRADARHVRHP